MATLRSGTTIAGINVLEVISPIGSVIGVHPDCTVTPNATYWLHCDGATGTLGANFGARSGQAPPDLTDSRFLMGSTAYGVDGSNTMLDHTHTESLTAAGQTHTGNASTFSLTAAGQSGGSHYHNIGYNNQDAASSTNNGSMVDTDYAPWERDHHTSSTAHTHSPSSVTGSVAITHTHAASSVSGTIGSGSAPTSTSILPLYFKVKYYIRIT